jgi:hypothetical protein
MSGKSRQLWLVHATHLEGACINAASISPQSYTDGGNNSNHIVLQQEAPHDQVLDPFDGKRHGSDLGANPQKANIMKTMLTEFIASCITLRLDPQTGQRIRSTFISRASNVYFQCANWDIGGNAPAPILSRYIRIELQLPSTKEAAADVQGQARPRGAEEAAVLTAITRFFHLFHGLWLKTERMISAGGIADVQKDMALYMQLETESHLKEDLGVPQANISARKSQQTLLLARELCQGEALFRLLATHEGHRWLEFHKLRTPFCWEAIANFVAPLLKIQAHHISYAMTLLGFQIVSQVDTDAIAALAMMAKAQDPQQREPLLTDERDFPGDAHVARELGVFGTPNVQAQNNAGALVTMAPQHGTLQADHGWICIKAATEDALVNALAQLVYDKIKISPLPNQLRGILRAKMDLMMDSRYYRYDSVTKEIIPLRNKDGIFEIRRLPAMRSGIESGRDRSHKAKYWIALNIDYLQKHHAIPIAKGATEEILADIARGLSDAEKERYRVKVAAPLSRRLDIEEVDYADAIKPAFINRLCEVDVLRHPIAHALRMTLENPVFGLSRQDYAPGRAIDDEWCTSVQMLLFVQPPDIKLRVKVSAQAAPHLPQMVTKVRPPSHRYPSLTIRRQVAYLPLGFVQQRLTITRNTQRAVPVFRNGNRQRFLGEWMIKRSLESVASPDNPFIKWSTALAHHLEMDYDALSAKQRDEELGLARYRDPFYVKLHNDARSVPNTALQLSERAPTLDHVPYHFPPLQRALLKVLDLGMLDSKEAAKRLVTLRYPHANVKKEIEDLKKFIEQPITGKFTDIHPLSRTLLRCPRTDTELPPLPPPPPVPAVPAPVPPHEDAMDLDEDQPAPAVTGGPRSFFPEDL